MAESRHPLRASDRVRSRHDHAAHSLPADSGVSLTRVPVRASSLQTVPQVIHAVQELTAGQRVVTQLLQVLGPEVLSPVPCHRVVTWKQQETEGELLPDCNASYAVISTVQTPAPQR